MSLALDVSWAAGLLFAMIRVAAFVVACPLLPRAVPMVARAGVVVVLGLFLADPMPGAIDLGTLLGGALVNAGIGFVLGYLVGLIFHLFPVAGSVIDVSSGLGAASLFDPSVGEHGAVFSRLFAVTALTIFLVAGGLQALVRGLALSVDAIPLDGQIAFDPGLLTLAVNLTSRLVVAGIELSLPVTAALFGAEVALGLASRFAPQMNVFMLGLPLKILLTIGVSSSAVLLFPEATSGLLEVVRTTFVQGINGLAPEGP